MTPDLPNLTLLARWHDLPVARGIYALKNTANGKVYIGSSVGIRKRCQRHDYELRAGLHYNTHLQAAWWLHRSEAFAWTVLALIDSAELTDLVVGEQAWINRFHSDSEHFGYNKAPAGRTRGRAGAAVVPS